jgi:hypothetical protein
VEGLLAKNRLAEAAMIATNDHDFLKLVHKLRESGRTVYVTGPHASKRFEGVAHKVTSIWEWLGGHPEKISDEGRALLSTSIPNALPL